MPNDILRRWTRAWTPVKSPRRGRFSPRSPRRRSAAPWTRARRTGASCRKRWRWTRPAPRPALRPPVVRHAVRRTQTVAARVEARAEGSAKNLLEAERKKKADAQARAESLVAAQFRTRRSASGCSRSNSRRRCAPSARRLCGCAASSRPPRRAPTAPRSWRTKFPPRRRSTLATSAAGRARCATRTWRCVREVQKLARRDGD